MNAQIGITGLGMISAVGADVKQNLASLRRGESGVSTLHFQRTKYADSLLFGEVKRSTAELADEAGVGGLALSRSAILALLAFREAVNDAGLTPGILRDPRTAFVNGATVGGVCLSEELMQDVSEAADATRYIDQYDTYAVTEAVRAQYALAGTCSTINTACSSSANAIQFGARLIRSGKADRVIVGGADAIARFTINGFNALRLLSAGACRPFDASRDGLNIGEGAAYLVLEKESLLQGRHVHAWFSGYGNANDAFHPTSLGPEAHGPIHAMERALVDAGLKASDIGMIHAHGTGTENNDEVERKALAQLFGTTTPFYSTKGATGHTLGAAGAMGAVVSILSLVHQELHPSVGYVSSDEGILALPNTTHRSHVVQHAMANAFGFGGNCTSLIFSRS